MRVEAEFVRSAAGRTDFPADRWPELALVGRSNVGKSSLINALSGRSIARTSRRPGKTRLANVYRVARGAKDPIYVIDLPGYGYAGGGAETAREFERLTGAYFGRGPTPGLDGQEGFVNPARPATPAYPAVRIAALLVVDARHPGLARDIEAWRWLPPRAKGGVAIVATKIDKLARGERIRAMRKLESVFEHPVLPVSAVTGEGMEDLWKLIDRLANNSSPHSSLRSSPQRATALRHPKN